MMDPLFASDSAESIPEPLHNLLILFLLMVYHEGRGGF